MTSVSRGGDGRTACPTANELAAYLEGTALAAERERLESHLTGCPTCRETVAHLAAEPVAVAMDESGPAGTRPVRRGTWLAAAALVILTLGIVWAASELLVGTPPVSREQLVAVAADLREQRSELFAGFEPLTREEMRAIEGSRTRGGATIHSPRGVVGDTRPLARWLQDPAVETWRVTVFSPSGQEVWQGSTPSNSLALEGLERGGRYVLEVRGTGAFGEQTSTVGFRVASEQEVAALRTAFEVIGKEEGPLLSGLLQVHYALRRERLDAAEQVARELAAKWPEEELVAEAMWAVLEWRGDPDAAVWRRRAESPR